MLTAIVFSANKCLQLLHTNTAGVESLIKSYQIPSIYYENYRLLAMWAYKIHLDTVDNFNCILFLPCGVTFI